MSYSRISLITLFTLVIGLVIPVEAAEQSQDFEQIALERLSMYQTRTENDPDNADKEIVAQWAENGNFFFKFSDGTFGAIFPSTRDERLNCGKRPPGTPDVRLVNGELIAFSENERQSKDTAYYDITNDAFVFSGNADGNYGSSSSLIIGNNAGYYYSLLRPSNFIIDATIFTCKQYVEADSCSGTISGISIESRRISGAFWSEGSVTYNNYPSYSDSGETRSFSSCPSGWVSWTITSICQGWSSGTMNIYGIMLKYPTGTGSGTLMFFQSTEGSGSPPDIYVDYAVTLGSFYAAPMDGKVLLEWTAQSEVNNAGFNIYRADQDNVTFRKLNQELILGGVGSYSFVDDVNITNGKRFIYRLEDVDLTGTITQQGIRATIPLNPDVDSSGVVDLEDLDLFLESAFSEFGEPNFSSGSDINNDNRIDQKDLRAYLDAFDFAMYGFAPGVRHFSGEASRPFSLDMNSDGEVDNLDLLVLASGYMEQEGSTNYLEDSDLDSSGRIDRGDIDIYIDGLLSVSLPARPPAAVE